MSPDPGVAHRLRVYRRHSKLSRSQVAKASGLSEKTIQRAEEVGTNNRAAVRLLAAIYDVHPIQIEFSREEVLAYLQIAISSV